MNARKEFLSILFDVLEREAVPYCILRNFKNVYEDLSSDIDLIVDPENLDRFLDCMSRAAERSGHFLVHRARYVNFSFVYGHQNGRFVRIDVETEVRWRFFPVLSAKAVLGLRRKYEGFYIPHPRHEAVILFVAAIWRGVLPERYRNRLAELYSQLAVADVDASNRTFEAAFGKAGRQLALSLDRIGHGQEAAAPLKAVRRSLVSNAFRSTPNFRNFADFLWSDLRRFVQRVTSPPGISLIFISSAALREDPDKLFEKIEFLYPIKKSARSVCVIGRGEGHKAGFSLRMRLTRWYTLFKGGLFLRVYQLVSDKDTRAVVRAHSHWLYRGRAFICAQNNRGRMWVRHALSGSTARSQKNDRATSHDHLIQFILEKIESLSSRSSGNSTGRPSNHSASGETAKELSGWRDDAARTLRFRRLAYSAAWLLLIGLLSFLSLGFLKSRAKAIAEDTLPGLTYAGAADANAAQAFNRTLMLLMSDDPQQRAELSEQIEKLSNRTTTLLVLYKSSIYDDTDARLFGELLRCRSDYLRVREKTLFLSEREKRAEASILCQTELLPAYSHYKESADRLFEFNMHQGQHRGKSILNLCTIAQCLAAAVAIGIFVTGFVMGLSRQLRFSSPGAPLGS